MSSSSIGLLGVAVYLALVGIVVLVLWRGRRAERSLRWAPSTTQQQMERYGTRTMTRLGWNSKLLTGVGTKSVFHCYRNDEHLFIVFLRESSSFSRLLPGLLDVQGLALNRTLIVLFEPPTEPMVARAAEIAVSLTYYRDLPDFEEIRQAMIARERTAEAERFHARQKAASAG